MKNIVVLFAIFVVLIVLGWGAFVSLMGSLSLSKEETKEKFLESAVLIEEHTNGEVDIEITTGVWGKSISITFHDVDREIFEEESE